MIIIVGLVILVAAVVVGVAGVLGNGGSAHPAGHFAVLGYHLNGSAGALFLTGIVVGAAGLAGLSLLLAGARRTSRRGRAARQGLKRSRRETAAASQDRDDLLDEREAARASTASTPGNGSRGVGPDPRPDREGAWSRLFGHRTTTPQRAATPLAETLNAPPAADVSAGASTPADASATAD